MVSSPLLVPVSESVKRSPTKSAWSGELMDTRPPWVPICFGLAFSPVVLVHAWSLSSDFALHNEPMCKLANNNNSNNNVNNNDMIVTSTTISNVPNLK